MAFKDKNKSGGVSDVTLSFILTLTTADKEHKHVLYEGHTCVKRGHLKYNGFVCDAVLHS